MYQNVPLRNIVCESCGSDYHTKRRNTKVCAICRLHRNLQFLAQQTRKCWICSREFAPTSREDVLCANCDEVGSTLHGHGDCAYCGAEDVRTIRQGLRVCTPCAHEPAKRKALLHGLAKKVAERRANPERLEPPEAPAPKVPVDDVPAI